jgi:hypothetical protein
MYGLHRWGTDYNGHRFEETKGVIIVRTSKDRLQGSKTWRYQRGNQNPYMSVLRCTDYDYPFGIFQHLAIVVCLSSMYGLWLLFGIFNLLAIVVCPSMYGLWLPLWYLQTFGLCSLGNHNPYINEGQTTMAKVWKYQTGNQKPYIVEGQTTMAKGLCYLQTFGHCSLSLIDVWIMITPLVSSNFWPL